MSHGNGKRLVDHNKIQYYKNDVDYLSLTQSFSQIFILFSSTTARLFFDLLGRIQSRQHVLSHRKVTEKSKDNLVLSGNYIQKEWITMGNIKLKVAVIRWCGHTPSGIWGGLNYKNKFCDGSTYAVLFQETISYRLE